MIKPSLVQRNTRNSNNIVPTIKISLDELIKETFARYANGDLEKIIESKVPSSNQIMMDYIKSIYSQYDIPDPLHANPLFNSRKKPKKLSVSEQKIMRMKESSKNYTPSTEKHLTSTTASIKKRIMSPAHSYVRDNLHIVEVPTSILAKPNQQQKSQNKQVKILSLQIEPVFRYCVMCESPILQSNILIHQQRCRFFKNLYECSNEEIVSLLMQKINRLKKQVDALVCSSSYLLKREQQEQIKSSVREWLSTVDCSLQELSFGMRQQRLYDNMMSNLNNNTFTLVELTKKLKWFIRIREQLKIKFNI